MKNNQLHNHIISKKQVILFISNAKKTSVYTLLIPFTFLLGGCGNRDDLVRIQKFTTLASQASEAFPKIANDFYFSCLRATQHQAFLPERAKSPVVVRITNEQSCPENINFGSRLIAANNILIAYLNSLGKLASNDAVDYSSDIDNLKAEISQIPNINSSQIEGGINIAEILLNATTNDYRKEKLKDVIVSSNKDLQNFTKGLQAIVEGAYIDTYLTNESSVINGYYGDYIKNLLEHRTEGDTQALTVLLLELDDKWVTAKNTVEQRKSFAREYISLLKSIAQDHDAISQTFSNGNQPSSKELRKMLDHNTKALESFVEKSREVSGK